MGICGDLGNNRKAKTKQVTLSETEKALLECKQCRDKIKNYIKNLENREKKTKEKAKGLLRNKDKERAKFYLRQSKLFSKQIKVADGQLEMITNQITQLETTSTMAECMQCLKKGNEVLSDLHSKIKIEEWEKVKDDMDELKEKDKEIGDFLREYGINEAEYNEECNLELDKLMKECGLQEESNKEKTNKNEKNNENVKNEKNEKIDLPSVPKTAVKVNNGKKKVSSKKAVAA